MTQRSFFRACVFLSAYACRSIAGAQEIPAAVALADERAARAEDTQSVVASPPGRMARAFSWAESKVDAGSQSRDGFYPEFGGLIGGSGLSVGPGYRHRVFGDRAVVDVSGALSSSASKMMQSQLGWRGLFSDRLAVGAQVKYQDFTQINFFGLGGDSLKSRQADYRLTDLDVMGFGTLRANRWLTVSGRVGLLRSVDIKRGTSALHPSIGDEFSEITAPGLTSQPGYLHADVAVDLDTRDVPGHPASGGRYRFSIATYRDQDFSHYSFRRFNSDAAQYVPLFKRSVLALRGRVDLSQSGDGQDVPFYLLPALGGPTSLRGYDHYRFRDRDALLLNAEYVWPILRALDGALFYDAGTVAPRVAALSMHHLHKDYGVGLRLHSARHMITRFDVARSHEGTRAWLTFTAPLGPPSRIVVPYVP